jgi:prepilin-type N-terminal cleavage/methylation domain-containing protein
MKKATGFTLVEIMIALVIVGILASVAIPTYRNYVITAEIAEGLLFADAERINIELFYETHGRMPASWAEAGVIPSLSVDRMRQVLWARAKE